MKTFLKWLAGIILTLVLVYFAGPKVAKPAFPAINIDLPASLSQLEEQINSSEKSVKGIKPDNEARIVWADTSRKERTKIAILYLHGFSASQAEGEPVHRNLAKKYNANLYLARLHEHGIDRGDSTMIDFNTDEYVASAEKHLQLLKGLAMRLL